MDRIRGLLAPLVVAAIVGACDPSPASPSPPSGEPSQPSPSAGAPSPSTTVAPSEPAATVAWTRLTIDGDVPEARSGHTWTIDPSDAAAYLFGGEGVGGPLDDIWRYDLGADAWEQRAAAGPRPPPRTGHVAVFVDEVGLVVLGGTAEDGTILADGWAYDPLGDAWTELALTGETPPARTDACAAVGPDGRIWVSQGLGPGGGAVPQTSALDPQGWSWSLILPDGAGPAPRGAQGCWWTADRRLVIHGGRDEVTVYGDTWAIDDTVAGSNGGVWSSVDTGGAVIARSDFGSMLARDRIVMVAGAGADRLQRDDVVALAAGSLAIETFVPSDGAPDPRIRTAIVDDPGNERSLLFGGSVDGSPTDELWSFDLR